MKERPDVFGDLQAACRTLADASAVFRLALDVIGAPVVRRRPGGFEGLFRIIVEQQVSVSSAQAILGRINAAVDMGDAAGVRALGVEGLRGLGVSRPKAGYVVGLADLAAAGAFCFETLAAMDDEAARDRLQSIKGVGPWTASIYLLFCEGRADVWPPSDVALKGAFNHAFQLSGAGPLTRGPRKADDRKVRDQKALTTKAGDAVSQRDLDAMASRWAPLRGVAAHILWTYYAHIKNRAPQ